MTVDVAALDRTIATLTRRLLERREPSGMWKGMLASSALSTATAVIALTLADRKCGAVHADLVRGGVEWLGRNQNPDGGWGDTVVSFSNLSTTLLCWSALAVADSYDSDVAGIARRAQDWIQSQAGEASPDRLKAALLERYGKDRTFSVPILTVLCIAGKLGSQSEAWRRVPQLPFELAAFPHQFFQWLRLPVVSYALPALVAIGQVRHHRAPSLNPALRALRSALRTRTLDKARGMQPESGGYLEATPLTAFVTMSLIEAQREHHAIVKDALRFLRQSVRSDGSWPIDTDLSTWVTTLAVNALVEHQAIPNADRDVILRGLLHRQFKEEHPFTHAAPGGWAWTDLTGGVPDADDTSGALIALWNLAGPSAAGAASAGVRWLLDLQNRDGGMPTFCRGWGALPFDQSAPDLTAHALEAWSAWHATVDRTLQQRLSSASERAVVYLHRQQRPDGSWVPLWFGNQHASDEQNPTFGTARVVSALGASLSRQRGVEWLLKAQNANGGWGGSIQTQPSIEETALALSALAFDPSAFASVAKGTRYLIETTNEGHSTASSPIGLYFARLWYYEELYPLVFALRGLARVRASLGSVAARA